MKYRGMSAWNGLVGLFSTLSRRGMSKFYAILAATAVITLINFPASAQLGSNNPPDDQLLTQRAQEGREDSTTPPTCPSGSAAVFNSGSFDVAVPPAGTRFSPVGRVPRRQFGVVCLLPLQLQDLNALVYPRTSATERQALSLRADVFYDSAYAWREWAPQ